MVPCGREARNGPTAFAGWGVTGDFEAAVGLSNAGRKARTTMTHFSATTATMTATAIFQAPTPAGLCRAARGASGAAEGSPHPFKGVFALRHAQRMRKKPTAMLVATATNTVSAPILCRMNAWNELITCTVPGGPELNAIARIRASE